MTVPVKTLADRFRRHGLMMPVGLYRTLILAMADDLEQGGVVAEICRDWLDAPSSAIVQLRLLGGLQRLVLQGRAPQLARYYPNLGGTSSPEHAWSAFEPVLRAHVGELRAALELAPQTNEPGRSVPLLLGIFDAVQRSGLDSIRLLEVGASAGLNLLVDRFRIGGDGWASGPTDSPLQLRDAVEGTVRPVRYRIISRRGCDLAPIDATSAEGRLRLTSFVWPHDLHRHERLRAALAVAAAYPVTVDAAAASTWLDGQLGLGVDDEVLTVIWHSTTRQYWPLSEIAAVAANISAARARIPIAHVAMESPVSAADSRDRRGHRPAELTIQLSAPGAVRDAEPRLLGTVADHGVPVRVA
ncbi:MAG TPA: DUF2332 domain-containing protein [Jatrophihabitans sp.]|nr:DUF2332 domain-containing protein [Jatrophihabitans sp.]